jgi:hypothetical protein
MGLLLLFGGLSGNRPLQGVVAAQSNTSGTLTVQAPLVAATAAQSVVTGTLTNTALGSNPLIGTIVAQSDVAGQIKVVRPLQGVIAAQSSMTWSQPVAAGGKFVLTKAKIVLGGVDISRFCNTVQMNLEADELDFTPIGSDYRVHEPGPLQGDFELDLFADPLTFTPAFWASLDTPTTLTITPRSDLITAKQNPTWSATAIVVRKTELTGSTGEAAKASVQLHSTGPVLQLES